MPCHAVHPPPCIRPSSASTSYAMLCHAMLYILRLASDHHLQARLMPCYAMPCCTSSALHQTIICKHVLCHAMPCHAVHPPPCIRPSSASTSYAMLCHAM